jgi:membrane-bound lytic murein transglycosylase MltF
LRRFPTRWKTEDKLEMLNAGLFEFVVVDDWKAKMWAQVLPKIKVREDLVLRPAGRIGFCHPREEPQARRGDRGVLREGGQARPVEPDGEYYKRVKRIGEQYGRRRVESASRATTRLFEKYGARYGFDPLMLAAQGFQESRLRQEARSPVGAIGVMQLMPATGRDLSVGDITQVEPNIHGGAKYMDHLMRNYFPDAKFSEANRTLFAFASYNAGPGNISKMRKEASRRGLDPTSGSTTWKSSCEKIGLETTTYVRNIYKYLRRLPSDASGAGRHPGTRAGSWKHTKN